MISKCVKILGLSILSAVFSLGCKERGSANGLLESQAVASTDAMMSCYQKFQALAKKQGLVDQALIMTSPGEAGHGRG